MNLLNICSEQRPNWPCWWESHNVAFFLITFYSLHVWQMSMKLKSVHFPAGCRLFPQMPGQFIEALVSPDLEWRICRESILQGRGLLPLNRGQPAAPRASARDATVPSGNFDLLSEKFTIHLHEEVTEATSLMWIWDPHYFPLIATSMKNCSNWESWTFRTCCHG